MEHKIALIKESEFFKDDFETENYEVPEEVYDKVRDILYPEHLV